MDLCLDIVLDFSNVLTGKMIVIWTYMQKREFRRINKVWVETRINIDFYKIIKEGGERMYRENSYRVLIEKCVLFGWKALMERTQK